MSSKSKLYIVVIVIVLFLSVATSIYRNSLEEKKHNEKVQNTQNTIVATTEIQTNTPGSEKKEKATPTKFDEVLLEYTREVRNFKTSYIKAFNENNIDKIKPFVIENSVLYKELNKNIKKNNKKTKIELVDLKIDKYENKNDGKIILHTTEQIKTGNDTKKVKYTYIIELELDVVFASMKEAK